jgi:cellulose synthase operon protein B
VPTQALTPGNLRLIIAGWLSQNIAIYLGALAALAVVLTGFTYRLVRISGVRE